MADIDIDINSYSDDTTNFDDIKIDFDPEFYNIEDDNDEDKKNENDIDIDNFEFDPNFYNSDTDDEEDKDHYNEHNNEHNNTNDVINQNSENKYLEQFRLFNELRIFVENKVSELKKNEIDIIDKITKEKFEGFTKLENEKNRLETIKENLTNELSELLKEENELLNPGIDSVEFKILDDTIYNENIKKYDDENNDVVGLFKLKQKQKNENDAIRDKYYQDYQSELLQIKINMKGNRMIWDQRNEYLKNKLNETEKDFNTFEKKWSEYVSLYENNKSDIEETIQVLKEDIDNMESNTKIERRNTIKMIKEWEEEKENNKQKIKIYTEQINNLEKERDILKQKQTEWIQSIKKENVIMVEKIKADSNAIEVEIKMTIDEISRLEHRIKEIEFEMKKGRNDLDGTAWNVRQEIATMNQKKMILNEKYNHMLLEMKKQNILYNKMLTNDPFVFEINRVSSIIKQNQYEIISIKKTTEQTAQKNKEMYTNIKNKFINIRFEIKNEMDTLNKLKIEFENQEIKHLEDKENKRLKIQEVENEIKEHSQYLNDLLKQNQMDNNKAKEQYDANIFDLEENNKKLNYELNQLKTQSTKILKSKDEYVRKRNNVRANNKCRLDGINKRRSQIDTEMMKLEEQKTKWRNDFLKYNNHCDFLDKQENDVKLNTLKEIQELYKTRNNAEFELNNNKLFA
jgi:hypothetical protein